MLDGILGCEIMDSTYSHVQYTIDKGLREFEKMTKDKLLEILEDYTVPAFNAIHKDRYKNVINDILKSMEWRSVEDELPEESNHLIVHKHNGLVIGMYYALSSKQFLWRNMV